MKQVEYIILHAKENINMMFIKKMWINANTIEKSLIIIGICLIIIRLLL